MIKGLTFDVFGTIFDLKSSFLEPIKEFLRVKGSDIDASKIFNTWRWKQRVLMLTDTLMMKGHHSYKTLAQIALIYALNIEGLKVKKEELDNLMTIWYDLKPFPDVKLAIREMKEKGYKIAFLSNGDNDILRALAQKIDVKLDAIISSEDVGVYKPHPKMYEEGVRKLILEVNEIIHVASHSWDVFGAKAYGMRTIYVDRYNEPLELLPYHPDYIVRNFHEIIPLL